MSRTYGTILALLLSLPAYAGDPHHEHAPAPAPLNVPDEGSNHNALAIGLAIAAGVCIYHKCWQTKPAKIGQGSIVPEPPRNEFVYEVRP